MRRAGDEFTYFLGSESYGAMYISCYFKYFLQPMCYRDGTVLMERHSCQYYRFLKVMSTIFSIFGVCCYLAAT